MIGQSSFTTSTSALSQTGLSSPVDLKFDSGGNLWVTNYGGNSVLGYTTPFSTGQAASLVIGESSFTTKTFVTNSTNLDDPIAIAFDSGGNLWVSDGVNQRVLEFPLGSGFTSHEAASLEIGQVAGASEFTTSAAATTQTGLYVPDGLAFDSGGNLWVADYSNNRVLEFPSSPSSTSSSTSTSTPLTSNLSTQVLCSGTGGYTACPSNIPSGTYIEDQATLTLSSGATSDGTVSFSAYTGTYTPGTGTCTLGEGATKIGYYTTTSSVTGTGQTMITSSLFDPSVGAGTYFWYVQYSGTGSGGYPSASECEPFTIGSSTSTSTTTSTSTSTSFVLVCPSTLGGTYMPVGATFKDNYGNTWVAPSGKLGGGTWSSYFFPGSQSTYPPPMQQGWGGDYGTYNGQSGWVVTFYCP